MSTRERICKICLWISIAILSILICIYLYFMANKIINNESTINWFGLKPFIMRLDSIESKAEKGDLIIAKDVSFNDIKIGDVILYKSKDFIYVKKVLDIEDDKKEDINLVINKENNIKINKNNSELEGKVIGKVPELGYIISFFKTIIGCILVALFIICIIIIMSLLSSKRYDEQKKEKDHT